MIGLIFLLFSSCKNKVEKQYSLICNDNYKYWFYVGDEDYNRLDILSVTCFTSNNRMISFAIHKKKNIIYKTTGSDVVHASLWKLDNDSILSEAWNSLDDEKQSKLLIKKLTQDTLILVLKDPGSVVDGYTRMLVSPPDSLKHLLIHPDSIPYEPADNRPIPIITITRDKSGKVSEDTSYFDPAMYRTYRDLRNCVKPSKKHE